MIFVSTRGDVRPEKRDDWLDGVVRWFFGWLPSVLVEVPKIVYRELDGDCWEPMGEVRMD